VFAALNSEKIVSHSTNNNDKGKARVIIPVYLQLPGDVFVGMDPQDEQLPSCSPELSFASMQSPKDVNILACPRNLDQNMSPEDRNKTNTTCWVFDPVIWAILDSLPGGTGMILPSVQEGRLAFSQYRDNHGAPVVARRRCHRTLTTAPLR
jgi:hypothetical protein